MDKYTETKKIISEIDEKSEKLKNKILNSKSKYTVKGNAYYVSPKGNDKNDGRSPETAWKTLSRISNAPELKKGDVVLLERGKMVTVTYYLQGEYVKMTGLVALIDNNYRILRIVDTKIHFDDVIDIEFE